MSFLHPGLNVYSRIFLKELSFRAGPVSKNVIAFAYIIGAVMASFGMRAVANEIISAQNVSIRFSSIELERSDFYP